MDANNWTPIPYPVRLRDDEGRELRAIALGTERSGTQQRPVFLTADGSGRFSAWPADQVTLAVDVDDVPDLTEPTPEDAGIRQELVGAGSGLEGQPGT